MAQIVSCFCELKCLRVCVELLLLVVGVDLAVRWERL